MPEDLSKLTKDHWSAMRQEELEKIKNNIEEAIQNKKKKSLKILSTLFLKQ
ncbi:hypothetical protein [Desulfamplus magnetovallimortis]|uniref:hypothetical protein n=1 Tax=Desulfamplus magnetovallimortis TaxID=1246637 RepID=UPI0016446B9E|nr:hypothetical protein [Desulfamplus magnetovallimortis]